MGPTHHNLLKYFPSNKCQEDEGHQNDQDVQIHNIDKPLLVESKSYIATYILPPYSPVIATKTEDKNKKGYQETKLNPTMYRLIILTSLSIDFKSFIAIYVSLPDRSR